MYKILLICAGGMSTGFILKKIEKVAIEKNIQLQIMAIGSIEVKKVWHDYDYFLIAPQVRFDLANIQKITEGTKKVTTIPAAIYGRMDGEAILEIVEGMKNEETTAETKL